MSFKYPVLAGKVALALADEGGNEIRSAITNLILTARRAAVKSALIGGLLTARRLELFGLKPVTNARKPWTFADAIDNFVEKLPSASMRAFANQFIDAVEDSVIEMGYVIAYTIDDFYLAQRTATESDQQPDRTVEILPNEEEVVQATDGICFKAIAPRTDVTGATSG